MVATPLIAVFLDVRLAILLTLLPTATVNLATIFSEKNDWKAIQYYAPLIIFSGLGSLVGTWFLSSMDPNPFKLALTALTRLSQLDPKSIFFTGMTSPD